METVTTLQLSKPQIRVLELRDKYLRDLKCASDVWSKRVTDKRNTLRRENSLPMDPQLELEHQKAQVRDLRLVAVVHPEVESAEQGP